jgi:hypothetical protein
MATLIDSTILAHFGSIFVVFLLFAILYGIFEASKPFGPNMKGIHAIIALFIALLMLMSRAATGMVQVLVPWFIVLLIFLFFVMLLFRMFGMDDAIFKKIVQDTSVFPWIIIFSILVLFGALAAVFGQNLLSAGEGDAAPVVVESPDGSGTVIIVEGQPGTAPVYAGTDSTATDSFGVNLMNTLRHPKVLGLIFVLLTGAFLMIFLTKPVTK